MGVMGTSIGKSAETYRNFPVEWNNNENEIEKAVKKKRCLMFRSNRR